MYQINKFIIIQSILTICGNNTVNNKRTKQHRKRNKLIHNITNNSTTPGKFITRVSWQDLPAVKSLYGQVCYEVATSATLTAASFLLGCGELHARRRRARAAYHTSMSQPVGWVSMSSPGVASRQTCHRLPHDRQYHLTPAQTAEGNADSSWKLGQSRRSSPGTDDVVTPPRWSQNDPISWDVGHIGSG